MSRSQMILHLITIAFISLQCATCASQPSSRSGGPYYYGTFANYKVPFQPLEELSYEEAKLRESYYVAYFDSNSRIIGFSKYLKGKMEFEDKYVYSTNGILERRELIKNTGEVTIQHFNRRGEITKTESFKKL
jgi:hypothetical protein